LLAFFHSFYYAHVCLLVDEYTVNTDSSSQSLKFNSRYITFKSIIINEKTRTRQNFTFRSNLYKIVTTSYYRRLLWPRFTFTRKTVRTGTQKVFGHCCLATSGGAMRNYGVLVMARSWLTSFGSFLLSRASNGRHQLTGSCAKSLLNTISPMLRRELRDNAHDATASKL